MSYREALAFRFPMPRPVRRARRTSQANAPSIAAGTPSNRQKAGGMTFRSKRPDRTMSAPRAIHTVPTPISTNAIENLSLRY